LPTRISARFLTARPEHASSRPSKRSPLYRSGALAREQVSDTLPRSADTLEQSPSFFSKSSFEGSASNRFAIRREVLLVSASRQSRGFSRNGLGPLAFLRRLQLYRLSVNMRQATKFPDRVIEPLEVRRKKQAQEAAQAMADYQRSTRAVRERMAALRAQRLARGNGPNGQEV
jgi:hypothetical protein